MIERLLCYFGIHRDIVLHDAAPWLAGLAPYAGCLIACTRCGRELDLRPDLFPELWRPRGPRDLEPHEPVSLLALDGRQLTFGQRAREVERFHPELARRIRMEGIDA
jgi:hypothetical protein